MAESQSEELLALNQRLLNSIAEADWATYRELSTSMPGRSKKRFAASMS